MIAENPIDVRKPEFLPRSPEFRVDRRLSEDSLGRDDIAFVESAEGPRVEFQAQTIDLSTPSSKDLLDSVVDGVRRDATRFPGSVSAQVNLALALLNAGRSSEAEAAIGGALAIDKTDEYAQSIQARVLIDLNRLSEAGRIFERLTTSYSHRRTALVGLAEIATRLERFDQASQIWAEIVSLDPHNANAHYHLGIAILSLGNPAKYGSAIKHLKIALREDPRSAAFYHGLAVGRALNGDLKRSENAFRVAIRLKPDFAESEHGLAEVLLRQGDADGAVRVLRGRIQRHPSDFRARDQLAWSLVAASRFADARQELFQALATLTQLGADRDGLFSKIANNLGVCYRLLGQNDEASRFFERSVSASQGSNVVPALNLARLLLESGKSQQAEELLRELGLRFRENEEARILLAEALVVQRKVDQAADLLRAWTSRKNATVRAFIVLSSLLLDNARRYAEGIDVLEGALRRYPDNPTLVNNLAYAHLMLGHLHDARETLLRLEPPGPSGAPSVELTATWGLLNLRSGDLDQAERLYRQAAEIANETGRHLLAQEATQKMFLEFARWYVEQEDWGVAEEYLQRGRSIPGRPAFREDLDDLSKVVVRKLAESRRPALATKDRVR